MCATNACGGKTVSRGEAWVPPQPVTEHVLAGAVVLEAPAAVGNDADFCGDSGCGPRSRTSRGVAHTLLAGLSQ